MRPLGVEGEVDHRLVVLIKRDPGVGEHRTVEYRHLFDQIFTLRILGVFEDHVAVFGRFRGGHVVDVGGALFVDGHQLQMGRFGDQFADPLLLLRRLDAGDFDQNFVFTLFGHRRLGQTELVESVSDRIDRLGDGVLLDRFDLFGCQGDRIFQPVFLDGDALKLFQNRVHFGHIVFIEKFEGDCVPFDFEIVDDQILILRRILDGRGDRFDFGADRLFRIDAQKHVQTALQVESQGDFGPLFEVEQRGHGEGDAENRRGDEDQDAVIKLHPRSFWRQIAAPASRCNRRSASL